ncbi:hypothetical protein Ahy_B08g090081 [Arachis hypogaea]|uniref:Uncharacterized protein n=1 Tax=Arachis hypogaea TaxID=3818 RepID=A0A444XZL8_ARAHY|nr:hypothetical protein Ahy_B08g090081 [Arachis hypogaea]
MKRIEILYYRIPISVVHDGVKYDSFVIDNDEDLQVLFYCDCQFPKVRIPDPLAKFVDVVSSSGKSNQNYQSVLMAAASSSTHVGASSSLLVMASIGDLVASLSFATYLHRDEIADVGAYINTPVMTSHSREVGEPNAVEDVLGDDDDVKPTMIEDENNDDIGRSILVRAGRARGTSSSSPVGPGGLDRLVRSGGAAATAEGRVPPMQMSRLKSLRLRLFRETGH